MSKPTTSIQGWEKRFDDLFGNFYHEGETTDFTGTHIKDFIQELVSQTKKETIEDEREFLNKLDELVSEAFGISGLDIRVKQAISGRRIRLFLT